MTFDKEAYKAGIRRGLKIAAETAPSEPEFTKEDELIRAINQLTVEVQKANAIREKVRNIKVRAGTSFADTENAIKALQKTLGVKADGKFGRTTYQKLYDKGFTYDNVGSTFR